MSDHWGVPRQRRKAQLSRSALGFGTRPGVEGVEEVPEREPRSGGSSGGGPDAGSGSGVRLAADPAAYAGVPVGGRATTARANTAATVGAALSFVPILGMILSILGLAKAPALGGAGRSVATVGLALSVAFTGGEAVLVSRLADSVPADPACVSARTELAAMQTRLAADEASMAHAESSGDPAGISAAEGALVVDLSTVKTALDAGLARATHADVRTGLRALDSDLGALISAARQVDAGNDGALGSLQSADEQLGVDARHVNELCGFDSGSGVGAGSAARSGSGDV